MGTDGTFTDFFGHPSPFEKPGNVPSVPGFPNSQNLVITLAALDRPRSWAEMFALTIWDETSHCEYVRGPGIAQRCRKAGPSTAPSLRFAWACSGWDDRIEELQHGKY